jgi:hypothetical protein
MALRMDHEDVMELAVQLACSYLSSAHSGSTDAEDLIFTYYQQIRNVEARLGDEYGDEDGEEDEDEAEEEEDK